MTLPMNPELVAALKKIGQGLFDLANAVSNPPDTASEPEPRPAARSPKKSPPPAEEHSEDKGVEAEEIKLADLQKMAKNLIKKGGRDKLLAILENHDLENVSSAPAKLWPELKQELEETSE